MARHKEFNQTIVLDRAMCLFWEQGYEATSIRDLIAHLGISSSSLYETYGDKHALYLAALAAYRQAEFAAIKAQLAAATSARETLTLWFEQLIDDLLADELFRGSFTVNAAIERGTRDADVAIQLHDHFEAITTLLADFLAGAQANGEISARLRPVPLAQFFISTLFSMSAQVKIYADRGLLENIASTALSILN